MKVRKLRKSRRFAQTQVTPGRGTPPLDRQTWAPGKIRALNGTRCIERGVSTRLARGLLFFSRRRRRFVLGMRRTLMCRLLRPLTLCRSLMMSGRRGWPALRMRWSRMRRGSGPRFRRSRARMLSCYGFGRFGFSSGRMRRGSRLGFYRSRVRMLGRCGFGRPRFSPGRTCMMRGSGFGFRASGGRMLGR